MSIEEINEAKPPSPEPKPTPTSAFPEQFPHRSGHHRSRSPLSNLPDYHHPALTTLRHGPDYPRNPAADIWREGAYERYKPGTEHIIDVEKKQDRWRCEYCRQLNERGVSKDDEEKEKKKKQEEEGKGQNGNPGPPPSRPGPPPSRPGPIRIPLPEPKGVQEYELVKCAKCGENINYKDSRYDPRDFTEDGVKWGNVNMPPRLKEMSRRAMAEVARQRVIERHSVNAKHRREEMERHKRESVRRK
jgi:DNA-directed RNA polymerase subunit RPC12/RpoP